MVEPFLNVLKGYLFFKTGGLRNSLEHKVKSINRFIADYRNHPDGRLMEVFDELRQMAQSGVERSKIETQLFAVISEAARRILDMAPFDVQLPAALVLRRGKVIRMDTGEGKTLVAPFSRLWKRSTIAGWLW
ncbi:MAG: hypothetical protein GY765_29635 [bacterium]|nr:hypothetical protein [bacterium]